MYEKTERLNLWLWIHIFSFNYIQLYSQGRFNKPLLNNLLQCSVLIQKIELPSRFHANPNVVIFLMLANSKIHAETAMVLQ